MQFLSKQINFHKLQSLYKKKCEDSRGSFLFVKQIGVAKWNLLMLVFLIFKKKMKLYPIETGNFKLDGGNVWGCTQDNLSRTNPADANNLSIAARCLLRW
jgi:hypothetical protein